MSENPTLVLLSKELCFKANKCVVCGEEESYLKKYVVPHEYRKYFPGKQS